MSFGTIWNHFGPFWTILAILDQVGQYGENGPKWSKIAQNGSKWSKMVPNGQKQFQAIIIGQKWSQCSSNSNKRKCASYPLIWCTELWQPTTNFFFFSLKNEFREAHPFRA